MEGSKDWRTMIRSVLTAGAGNMATQSLEGTIATINGITGGAGATLLVAAAGVATIEALRAGYTAIEAHLKANRDAAQLFEEDYSRGTVSIFLPNNSSDHSKSQRFLARFISLLQNSTEGKNSPLFRYAGIHYSENIEVERVLGTRFNLISLSSLVFAGPCEDARSGDRVLDGALHGSDLFLRSRLPHCLAVIFNYQPTFVETLRSSKIKHLNSVRFVIIVFSNLLVNLQHPCSLDPTTNIPLTDDEAIILCKEVLALITEVLLPDEQKNREYLTEIDCKDEFNEFLGLVQTEVKKLQQGYQSKKVNQLNLTELVSQSHGVVQLLNQVWHHLLYLDKEGTEPVQLLYLVRCLSNALDEYPQFWQDLLTIYQGNKRAVPMIKGLNQPYQTVIDLLGLFASLAASQRKWLLTELKKNQVPKPIIGALKQLNQIFIESLAEDLSFPYDNPARAYLMNLIALSVESRPIFLQEAAIKLPGIPTLKQQFSTINDLQMFPTDQSCLFTWEVWDTLVNPSVAKYNQQAYLHPQTLVRIKELLKAQYDFLGALRSVSALQDLVDSNRSLLLHKNIQDMIRKVLLSLRTKEIGLTRAIQSLITQVDATDKIINQDSKFRMANQRRKIIMQMDNPRLGLKLRSEQLNLEIDAVIETLDLSGFVEAIQTDLQDDVTAVYASHEDFLMARNELMLALQLPSFPQQNGIVSGVVSEKNSSNLGQQPIPAAAIQPIIQSLQPETQSRGLPSSPEELQLQLLLKIWLLTSFILLMVGVLISMVFLLGGFYVPVIAALSPITTGAALGGLISGVGGFGLGLYCFYNAKLEGLSTDLQENHLMTGMNQISL